MQYKKPNFHLQVFLITFLKHIFVYFIKKQKKNLIVVLYNIHFY